MNKEVIEIPLRKATYEELQQVICELQLERYIKNKEVEQLKEKIDKAIKYINIETQGCDEEPIEGSWLYDLYAIRDILGDKEDIEKQIKHRIKEMIDKSIEKDNLEILGDKE